MTLAAVNWSPDVEAVIGGLGVGLSVYFVALLLTVGANIVRRMLNG